MNHSPFPGMDPYLEAPRYWKQVHTQLVVEIQKFLAPKLRPTYHIEIEELTHLTVIPPIADDEAESRVGIPDGIILGTSGQKAAPAVAPVRSMAVSPLTIELPIPIEIKHRYLKVRRSKDNEVITVIELLSPVNKLDKAGREKYLTKRRKILSHWTSLVEIDLLRAGEPMPMYTTQTSDYRILIRQGWRGSQADLYPFNIPDPIPDFPIPLQKDDEMPLVPLNQILHDLYEVIGYGYLLDYREPPPAPSVSADMAAWLESHIEPHLTD